MKLTEENIKTLLRDGIQLIVRSDDYRYSELEEFAVCRQRNANDPCRWRQHNFQRGKETRQGELQKYSVRCQ